MEFSVFLCWFAFSYAVGLVAASRGRSKAGWMILAMAFSPLLAFIFLMLIQSKSYTKDPATAGLLEPRVNAFGHQSKSSSQGTSTSYQMGKRIGDILR
jgi:hypothetical protein